MLARFAQKSKNPTEEARAHLTSREASAAVYFLSSSRARHTDTTPVAMATIYSGVPPQSRFPFSTHTHYTSNTNAAAQIQMQQFRYGSYGVENQTEILRFPSVAPPGASLDLFSKQQPMYTTESSAMRLSSPMYSNQNASASMYMQSIMRKMYLPQQPQPPLKDMSRPQSEMLLVSPGVPTPVELSIYEIKQPTGLLHVTIGNQTVEFLDGVVNMPQKR
ncbi:unnamed protein product [Peronospora belbahrii]|uniref:Uncharacterized protein n=1 Tax=Peronospora belbahrii TaxID=622444 RepID=A0AAU9L8P4_9STRA|nr:unnamed protein product [Peronospora belbahrii]